MRFDDYWQEVDKLNILSNEAIKFLPESLSDKTKKRLMKYSAEDAARLLDATVAEINNGSIETIDALLNKKLSLENIS